MTRRKKKPSRKCKATTEKEHKGNKVAVTPPQRRYYGLRNQGATCYLNSVLQVLFMTPEIHDRLNEESQTDLQLRKIFAGLKKQTCGTEAFTEAFGITNVCQQGDAPGCLEMILHNISSKASEVLKGKMTYTTKCSKGHCINEETNPFLTLPLSLMTDATCSVKDGFERIFQLTSFSGDSMVYCNECNNKTEATSRCEMVKFPQILTLLLKRFDFDYSSMSHVKSHCRVDVQHTLQMQNKEYELYGMVNHFGSLRGGHYTATILSNEDKAWYEFNDTEVNKVGEQPFAKNKSYTYV
ncbi:ubiquitin carboxyl-terminal hydrolase 47-like [Plectropomus leopardus]|uniref:ubiquitin carboxyl-terminal hydrolase 47-like n=1 Tax=Plectropomus leopardus TaxID=160734 RepID=UPI001C4BC338|nr:ubiquitin carboxyl-terminal hydrolase 47-like [Plectropomus leopardus]